MGYPGVVVINSGGQRSTKFLCCDVHSWCQAISWLQMLGGIIGAVTVGVCIHTAPTDAKASGTVVKETGKAIGSAFGGTDVVSKTLDEIPDRAAAGMMVVMLWILLVLFILSFFFGLMLMLGTTQKNLCFLWTWIVFTIADIFCCISILSNGPTAGMTSYAVIEMLLDALFVYVVYIRAKELGQQQSSGVIMNTV